jgi:uncharacterized glyoxalase superfamily protein PhnB/predicted kinase
MKTNPELVPLLVVRDAAHAIDFYVRALGAQVLTRFEHGTERRISHADLALGNAAFAITEEAREWNSDAPPSLGGSAVVLQLNVTDAAAVFTSMRAAGAAAVFPMQDLLGERMVRVRDPFGHIWIVRQRLQQLSIAELQQQRDELFARLGADPAARAKEESKLPGSNRPPQAPRHSRESAPGPSGRRAAQVHLVIGPVGAGKSTFALGLARELAAVRFNLDQWMVALFRPDRPDTDVVDWYVERAARCVAQIWEVANGVLQTGTHVVLEIGLLQQRERAKFYQRVSETCFDLTVHVLDAARDVRRQRVARRNRIQGATFSMVVPPEVFELASDLWERPDDFECEGRDIRFHRTDAAPTQR